MEREYNVDWRKALDAFEREYGLPNPIRTVARDMGKDSLTWREVLTYVGMPENHYPEERIPEMYAFIRGYAGAPLKTHIKILSKSMFSDDIDLTRRVHRIKEAYEKGRESAIKDGELKLESRLKKLLHVFGG